MKILEHSLQTEREDSNNEDAPADEYRFMSLFLLVPRTDILHRESLRFDTFEHTQKRALITRAALVNFGTLLLLWLKGTAETLKRES